MHKLRLGLFRGAIVADADRIAAALRYQQELEAAQRPATMNPNLAAQGAAAREFMAPPTSVMDDKYPAYKKSKDQSEQLGMAIDVLSAVIPMAGPAVKGARAVGRFAGPELAQGLENYMVKTGGILPLDVYHGTPHRFPPTAKNPLGEFDTAKIGTGEGAQAYGHGLYLAENPGVAKEYAKNLSENRLFDAKNAPFDVQANLSNPNVRAALYKTNGDIDAAIARARQAIEAIPGTQGAEYAAKDIQTLTALKSAGGLKKQGGSLYKVDLPDEQIAKMLDFNKPLKDQNPEIQKALQDLVKTDALGRPTGISVDSNMNGQWAYERLAGIRGAKYAAEAMREANIPGIRYSDQGSRGHQVNLSVKGKPYQTDMSKFPTLDAAEQYAAKKAKEGFQTEIVQTGTSNFVVFDPKHMNIIGRE